MLVSVIVPVYNVGQYIGSCIDSILMQDYKELEIILVDDGSTDNSGQICDDYAQKDSRIKVFHIENSGLSGARNYGTAQATGEFIYYLDGDDWFTEGAISSSVAKIKGNVDIVISKYEIYYNNTGERVPEPFEFKDEYVAGKSGEDGFACLISNIDRPLWSACRILFRRSLMVDNGISFRLRLLSEDVDIVPHLYRHAREIAVNNHPTFLYRMNRAGSIMTSVNPKRYTDIYDIITRWMEFLTTDTEISECFRHAMTRQMHKLYFSYLRKLRFLKKEDRKVVLEAAEPLAYLLDSECVNPKYRKLYKLLGFKGLVTVMRLMKR